MINLIRFTRLRKSFSWTNAVEFVEFCKAAGIRCEEVSAAKYFNPGMCDGAFLTEEYTYDAKILGAYYQEQLEKQKNVEIQYCARIDRITKTEKIICNSSGRWNRI